MNRQQAEQRLIDVLGDPMRALGKPTGDAGSNPYVGPALGGAMAALGLAVASFLDPEDVEVAAVPEATLPRLLKRAELELARSLHAGATARVRQQVGRDSEVHWQQLREGLAGLVASLESELVSLSPGAGGGFAGGPLRTGESPPRATCRDWS